MVKEKVAIIGMGISGMGTLVAYSKLTQNIEIDCYDTKTSFGRGYPFRVDSNDVLLNVRSQQVTFDQDKPDDFVEWLNQNNMDYGEYVPRHIFGQYCYERTQDILELHNVTVLFQKVERIDYIESNEKFLVTRDSGEVCEYDRVHLCCSDLPPKDVYQLNGQKNYIKTIYPVTSRFSKIGENDRVGVIGTSLSAIDVSRYLLRNDKAKEVFVFSRDNIFPTVRGEKIKLQLKHLTVDAVEKLRTTQNGFIQFDQISELFELELIEQKINLEELISKYHVGISSILKSIEPDKELDKIQSLYIALIDVFNYAWYGMNKPDRQEFNEYFKLMFQLFGAPTPLETGQILADMVEQDRLKVIDEVVDVVKEEDYFLIKQSDGDGINVDWIVNGTGLDFSLESLWSNSLLSQMLDAQLIQTSVDGGLLVLENGLKIVSPRYGVLSKLHAHGALISGVQLLNNDVDVIQKSALEVVKGLY